jgi:hypothetical protein
MRKRLSRDNLPSYSDFTIWEDSELLFTIENIPSGLANAVGDSYSLVMCVSVI